MARNGRAPAGRPLASPMLCAPRPGRVVTTTAGRAMASSSAPSSASAPAATRASRAVGSQAAPSGTAAVRAAHGSAQVGGLGHRSGGAGAGRPVLGEVVDGGPGAWVLGDGFGAAGGVADGV